MTRLSDVSRKALSLLVDPTHLTSEAMHAARAQFGKGANRHLVIDGFLAPHLPPLLQMAASEDAEFEDNLKLASASRAPKLVGQSIPRGKVDAASFHAAAVEDRFICQKRMIGARAGCEDTSAIKAEGFVRTMFASRPLHEWLRGVTGCAVSTSGGINLKLHGPGHFLKPHSDARPGRVLCAVIYLHRDWQPDYAGRFILHRIDGRERRIDPLPNRLILFEAMHENIHSIEPIGTTPEGWWRINYTIWFA